MNSAFVFDEQFCKKCLGSKRPNIFDMVVIEVVLGCFEEKLMITTCCWPETRIWHPTTVLEVDDSTLDPRSWHKYGEAIKDSKRIYAVKLRPGAPWRANRTIVPNSSVWRCIVSFFSQLQYNTHIKIFELSLSVICSVPLTSLHGMFSSNYNLVQLSLSLDNDNYQSTLTEANHLFLSLENSIYIQSLTLRGNALNNEVLETILISTEFVSRVKIECYSNDHIRILCNRFRFVNTLWQHVCFVIKDATINTDILEQDIISNLHNNKHVQTVEILGNTRQAIFDKNETADNIETLLCNTSSIRDIIESNHSISCINVQRSSMTTLGLRCAKYFSLNRNWKKSNVIKMKIMKFYLSREENKASLNDLALGALVNVIALTVPVKASAVYNILRSFPNLFNNNR